MLGVCGVKTLRPKSKSSGVVPDDVMIVMTSSPGYAPVRLDFGATTVAISAVLMMLIDVCWRELPSQ
jgi:hypothetical protein